jgi:hypothetical protein
MAGARVLRSGIQIAVARPFVNAATEKTPNRFGELGDGTGSSPVRKEKMNFPSVTDLDFVCHRI